MKKALVLLLWFLAAPVFGAQLTGWACGTGQAVGSTKSAACAYRGYSVISQGGYCPGTGTTCMATNGCGVSPSGICTSIVTSYTTCNSPYVVSVGANGMYACVNPCSGSLVTGTPTGQTMTPTGTNICATGVSCTSPDTVQFVGSTYSCVAPPCQQGTAFVGVGADTGPKCLDGCSYAISAPAVYGEVTAGLSGVHSRWVASGSTCTSADELVAADVSGCPDEVSPDMRAAICGIPAPCEDGKYLFSGECVADSAETGCVIVDGEQVCAEAEQNCVVINGKRVCAEVPESPQDLETYKENGCVWSFAQAGWVCPTDTATKTTTGTTTTETDPVTGNKTSTTVTTIRNNVTGGTTTTTTVVVTDPDGNEMSRDVSEETTGSGGEGGTLVARDPTALGEKPDLDWLRTAQEVKDNLSAQWAEVPLVAAVSSFSNLALTGVEGVCPEFCLPLWGETLCTTKHCEIWETVSGIIAGVLLALYGMAAIRIVLSA